jgi:hypothetical protein
LLTPSQAIAARKVMISKINILIQGGIKRGNTDIVDIYSKKLNSWVDGRCAFNTSMPQSLSW